VGLKEGQLIMDEKAFDQSLRELIWEAASLPADHKEKLTPLVEATKQLHKEIKDNEDKIADSLTNLRICIKYILFDLEATRRERDHLRAMLDNPQPPDELGGNA